MKQFALADNAGALQQHVRGNLVPPPIPYRAHQQRSHHDAKVRTALFALHQRNATQKARTGKLPVPDLANLDTYLEIGGAFDHEAEEVQAIGDYKGWWRNRLAAHHALRPIPTDKRLWKKKR